MTPIADPLLAMAAEILDDIEKTRIANENRLRQLTRSKTDVDGKLRGLGFDPSHEAVARLSVMVEALNKLEADAIKNLEKAMKEHPLGPWITDQHGIGLKTGARLLAAIGDPYWNALHDRPRTVSELWAYCGLKPGQRRTKGQQSNWSDDAKKRAWLIATSIVKAGGPWREVYDARKTHTEGRLHETYCLRCGPSGSPAVPGSPWPDAHRHADALRIVSKEVLKGLWREARRLHEEDDTPDLAA